MSKIRIEYVRLRPGGDEREPNPNVILQVSAAAAEVTAPAAWGVVAVAPALATDRNYNDGVFARIIALEGAALVGLSAADRGVMVSPSTGPVCLPVKAGAMISAVDAAVSVYRLANGLTLAAGERSAPVSGVTASAYALGLTATFANGASLRLQQIGPDGVTWMDAVDAAGAVTSFAAPGIKGAYVGAGSVLSFLAAGGLVENINASLS